MPFNGSGSYVPPSGVPVVSGTVIQSTTFNGFVSDIASTFNNVVTRDGQGGVTGPFKLFAGTSSLPGLSFNAESSTGMYWPGTGVLAFTTAGIEAMRLKSNGAVLINTTTDNGTSKLQVNGDVAATSFTGPLVGLASLNLPLAGGTLTGPLSIGPTTGSAVLNLIRPTSAGQNSLTFYDVVGSGVAWQLYQQGNDTALRLFRTGLGDVLSISGSTGATNFAQNVNALSFSGPLIGNVTGNVSGTAAGETLQTVTSRNGTIGNFMTVATSGSGNFITAYKTGPTYSDGLGAFLAKVDNPNGAANYFYQGVTNGATTFLVRADGLVTASAGFVGGLNGNVTGNLTGTASLAASIVSSPNRTDPTPYPVVWNTATGASQNYTCAAVTIQSSTGTLTANQFVGALTGSASSNVLKSGDTMSGTLSVSTPEMLRGTVANCYITGYTGGTRNGYIQFNTGATGLIVQAENSNPITLASPGGSLQIAPNGLATFSNVVSAPGFTATSGGIGVPGAQGFTSTTFASNARNPIWRFGNADTYGLSYFQGTSGNGATDTIGLHFGTATAAGSNFQFNSGGSFAILNGNLNLNGPTSRAIFGPNATWGSSLYVGGDGVNGFTRTTNIASIATTNGNLHLDAGTAANLYLNFYGGTGGLIFGNGAQAQVGNMTSAGVMSMAQFNGSGAGLTGVASALSVGGNAATSTQVAHSYGRTDATAYPVLWGTPTANSQLFSASAVTIQSSTGILAATQFSGSGAGLTGTAGSLTAGKASTVAQNGGSGTGMTFNWSGQSGQPAWLWGGNDGVNHYVYNPSNFSVAFATNATTATNAGYATNAGNATTATNATNSTNATYATSAGSATNATNATTAVNAQNHVQFGGPGDANAYFNATPPAASEWSEINNGTNCPIAGWWMLRNLRHTNGSNTWGVQHAYGWEGNANEFYTRRVSAGAFTSWQRYLHDGIIGQYAPTLTGAGASGTWAINISGTAANATNATNAGYATNAGSATSAGNSATVTSNAARTDSTPYPVVWNNSTGASPNYSCAAVTITSSTGTLNATYLNATLAGNALTGSYAWGGGGQYNYFTSTGSVGANTTANAMAYAATGSGNGAYMAFHRAGSYAINLGLDSDNVFRLGGWSDGSNVYRMQIDTGGNATFRGDITAFSDARLKKDVQVIPEALDKVEQVRGVLFKRISDDKVGTGVIAQELREVLPEAVQEDADGNLSVAYGNVVGLLIEAVKELSAKVRALEGAKA